MEMDVEARKDIRTVGLEELRRFFVEHGQKPFRANQVHEWLWSKSCRDFGQMTNLSQDVRRLLSERFTLRFLSIDATYRAQDGTLKSRIRLHDGLFVESALIPADQRITACVSSQVGCSLDCRFCATARLKRMRNLDAEEIYDQVAHMRDQSALYYQRPLTNVVFMGMGEPLLNYANVIAAIEKITSSKGLHMAARRITLSTAGIPKMIVRMADDEVRFNLAISLHSALDETRSAVMPINQSNPLKELAEALRYWYVRRKKKVTYEYIVWRGVNDNAAHVEALVRFCRIIPSKVNLIEYNAIQDGAFQQADRSVLLQYQHALESYGITTRIRKSRGADINAACGQLANIVQ